MATLLIFAHIIIIQKTRMKENNTALVDAIVAGLQEKKGKNIVVADLSGIPDCICRYFVICTGGSPAQVQTLAKSVGETVLKQVGGRPLVVDGMNHAQWVAMDYAEAIVHIFLPEERAYYDIEHLWADAELTTLEDVE